MGPYTATHILLDINPMRLMARDVMNLPCPVRSSRCHAQNQRDNATPRQRPAAMESQAERSGIRVSKSRGRLCITGPQYYWSSEQHLRSFLIRARCVRSQADSGQRTSWCLQAKWWRRHTGWSLLILLRFNRPYITDNWINTLILAAFTPLNIRAGMYITCA
jgi:hypothetical protein